VQEPPDQRPALVVLNACRGPARRLRDCDVARASVAAGPFQERTGVVVRATTTDKPAVDVALGTSRQRGVLGAKPCGQGDRRPNAGSGALGLSAGEAAAFGSCPQVSELVPEGEAADDPALLRIADLVDRWAGPALERRQVFIPLGQNVARDKDFPKVVDRLVGRIVIKRCVGQGLVAVWRGPSTSSTPV
jgi:hypothetical protein